jgi:lipopolysaccharide export LptBFGC system permease protein LptF
MVMEVCRVVAMTAAVLVCVVSFAAVVKFLAEGTLGPVDALRFMGLMAVPMMHYTLPFAAGFGATLAYHRMTADGELLAAHAGGIGHRSLLVPSLGAAVMLSTILGYLNQQVIPHMLRTSHRMIAEDIAKMVSTSIESGQSITFDSFLLHADGVRRFGADAASGASERMLLSGVVAVEFGRGGEIRSEATATRAWLWVFPPGGPAEVEGIAPGSGYIRMRLEDGVGVSGDQVIRFAELAPDPWVIPDSFRNDPKYFTNSEMGRLRERPELMHGVERRRLLLAQRLAERETMGEIKSGLINAGRARLVDATGQPVLLRGSDVRLDATSRRWIVWPSAPGRPIEVDRYMPDGTLARYVAEEVEISTTLDTTLARPDLSLRLSLTNVSSGQAPTALPGEGIASGTRTSLSIGPVYAAGKPLDGLIGLSSVELMERARPFTDRERPDPFIDGVVRDVRKQIEELEREITSKIHERWAMAAACLVMTLAGAVTAMRLGDALPLTVYLWSFFPALAGVITITSGQSMVHHSGASGLLVLWGGVGIVGVYALVSYVKVARH